ALSVVGVLALVGVIVVASGMFSRSAPPPAVVEQPPEPPPAPPPAPPPPPPPVIKNKLDLAYLPPDAEIFVHVGVAKALASPFVQHYLPLMKAQIEANPAPIDVVNDVESVTAGLPGLEQQGINLTNGLNLLSMQSA